MTIRASWRRRAADDRRVKAARTARSAHTAECPDLALQDGDLVAEHQDLGVLDVVGARQQGQPTAQPQEDQVKQAEGHESSSCRSRDWPRCRSPGSVRTQAEEFVASGAHVVALSGPSIMRVAAMPTSWRLPPHYPLTRRQFQGAAIRNLSNHEQPKPVTSHGQRQDQGQGRGQSQDQRRLKTSKPEQDQSKEGQGHESRAGRGT